MKTIKRTYQKPQGILVWGEDRHDVIRRANELSKKFRTQGQKLDTEHMKPHADIVFLERRYKQYIVPLIQTHKGVPKKIGLRRKA